MYLPSFFSLGARRILDLEKCTAGLVTEVKTCWWLRVNTAPIRSMTGSRYPHIVRFSYNVNGREYSGSRFLNWQNNPPSEGRKFRLFYDPEKPERYAIPTF